MASDAVQQIKERLSILDVVAPYVELHKAGKNYKGKSPFTNERTPSFYVSPDRGMYYCFSSSQGGDIFTFIEKMEGVDFKGALKILADKAGVELVPEDPKKRSERDQLYHVLADATAFFVEWLEKTEHAKQYLLDRGVTKETIRAWEVGYAPGPPDHGWRELRTHLRAKNYTDAELHKAGLVKTADTGKEPYDVFRDRIMFPIRDASGRVVAFSGRILAKESDAPKYVNSPETELFNKSETLFGYDKAKEGIRKFDFSLIVEGQFDVVLTHQAGYHNAVAVSGTALTPHHVALLQRLSNRVVLALDADRAGIAAVRRAADLMLTRGMDVKVARLPDGEDPADIVRKDTRAFKDIIGHATHVIEFLLSVVATGARDERTMKLRVRDEVIPYLLLIESAIDREHFAGVIAEALGSTTDAVMLEVARLAEHKRAQSARRPEPASEQRAPEPSAPARKDALINYCLVAAELLPEREREVVRDAFASIMGMPIEEVARDEAAFNPLLFRLEQEFDGLRERERRQEIAHNLQELRELVLKEKIRAERAALLDAERQGNETAAAAFMDELTKLQRELGRPPFDADTMFAT